MVDPPCHLTQFLIFTFEAWVLYSVFPHLEAQKETKDRVLKEYTLKKYKGRNGNQDSSECLRIKNIQDRYQSQNALEIPICTVTSLIAQLENCGGVSSLIHALQLHTHEESVKTRQFSMQRTEKNNKSLPNEREKKLQLSSLLQN